MARRKNVRKVTPTVVTPWGRPGDVIEVDVTKGPHRRYYANGVLVDAEEPKPEPEETPEEE